MRACLKWKVHPFTLSPGNTSLIASTAAASKSVKKVRGCWTTPNFCTAASRIALKISTYVFLDLLGSKAQASGRFHLCKIHGWCTADLKKLKPFQRFRRILDSHSYGVIQVHFPRRRRESCHRR